MTDCIEKKMQIMLFRQKGVKLDGFVDKNKQMKITGNSNYMNYMSKKK